MLRASSRILWTLLAGITILGLTGCPFFTVDPDKPEANFRAAPTRGWVPLTVQFTDTSLRGSGTIFAWSWDFGDGNLANTPNPRHQYTAAGVYTVRLSVQTAYGSDTVVRENLITVNPVSAVGYIGPEGGAVALGDATVTVPANARASETAVGIELLEAPFLVVEPPESVLVLSNAIRIAHDGEDLGFVAQNPDETLAPTTITLPFIASGVPEANRTGEKIHVLMQLEDGMSLPLFGDVAGGRITVPVASLPSRAVFGVVYRADSYSKTLDFSQGKLLSSLTWQRQWRLRLSPLMLQQLTALRIGDIDDTAPYSRRDFSQAQLDVTLAAIEERLEETTGRFETAGLRSPMLVARNGAYEVVFYNLMGAYSTDYERYAGLTPALHAYGALALDPRQLLNVSLHNAEDVDENADGAQELSFESAFAEALYRASFDGYDYPVVAAASPSDVDAAGNPLEVSFTRPLLDGVGAYVGQLLDDFATARSFEVGDTANLSDPLFSAFSASAPGYATAAQDFFLFLANAFDVDPLVHLFASNPVSPGVLERVRVALASFMGAMTFSGAQYELRLAADDALSAFFGQSLPSLYWFFARERAVEGGAANQLRPSDAARLPFTLQEDRFAEGHVVEAAFAEGEDMVVVSAATEPALRDIPPLSSRAVAFEVDPTTRNLTFGFNRDEWNIDSRGNSVGVKVYPEGEDGVELQPGDSTLVLNPYAEPCPLPNDPAVLLPILWFVFDLDGDGGLSLAE
ncbi:MAG TPA: PKD domain-containing protein, partial [Candidatus Hydrogenedentes bacterium]|nr:PKD domain-containing protein [Candidatus Hydrogenedentota bacterium]